MFHLRFTPYDISGYTFDFLEDYSRYVVAYEDKDKKGAKVPPHYHIYIETDYDGQQVRNAAKANLKIPKGGRGKNNAFYALFSDWKDKDYFFKWGDIRRKKGFSEEEVLLRVDLGKKKYLRLNGEGELSGTEAPAPSKAVRISDKDIIADLVFYYESYRKETKGLSPEKKDLVRECCRILRSYGKGINMFKVRDYIHAVWFDTEDNQEFLINKISGIV